MAERMMISKIVRTNGTRADLYARGHQWPDLKLFDLADLLDVGIDPSTLTVGEETPCRFWATYELSDRLNKAGNPYKDVVALEPMDKPATTTSTDNSALLAELRAIRALLEVLAGAGEEPEALDQAFPRYGDGSAPSENPAEVEAYEAYVAAEGEAPPDVGALRSWFASR